MSDERKTFDNPIAVERARVTEEQRMQDSIKALSSQTTDRQADRERVARAWLIKQTIARIRLINHAQAFEPLQEHVDALVALLASTEQRQTLERRDRDIVKLANQVDKAEQERNKALAKLEEARQTIARLTERVKELEEITDWYGSLVKRAQIGTKNTPSLKAYIEQLEAELARVKGAA